MNIFKTLYKTHSYKDYTEAESFAKKIPTEVWNKMSRQLFKNQPATIPAHHKDMRIDKVSKDVFKEGQLFYHGEQINSKNKNYIYDEDSIICEEMGDGLYISPSKGVAAFWAGISGKIFHLKLNTDRIAQVNQKQIETMISIIANNVEGFKDKPTGQRLNVIMRMLFQKNGYDACYSARSLSNGYKGDANFFDTVIGEPQRQLVVYNNDVVETVSKNLIDRISNQLLQIKSYFWYYVNLLKYYKNK